MRMTTNMSRFRKLFAVLVLLAGSACADTTVTEPAITPARAALQRSAAPAPVADELVSDAAVTKSGRPAATAQRRSRYAVALN